MKTCFHTTSECPCVVQHHAWNPSRPPHFPFHRRKADLQLSLCRRHRSDSSTDRQLQELTNRFTDSLNAFEKGNIFKYLEDTLFKYCSSTTDIRMMIATATAAMTWTGSGSDIILGLLQSTISTVSSSFNMVCELRCQWDNFTNKMTTKWQQRRSTPQSFPLRHRDNPKRKAHHSFDFPWKSDS